MPPDARQTPKTGYRSMKTPDATPPDTKPVVFISYSKADEEWTAQLFSRFLNSGKLRLELHRVEAGLVNDRVATVQALRYANVLVLLLSPSHLAASWIITNEYAELLLDLEREGRLKIVPVLLRNCSWQDNSFLRPRNVISSDGKPIAESSDPERYFVLRKLVSRIEQLATLSQDELKQTSATSKTSDPSPSEKAASSTDSDSRSKLTTTGLERFELSEEDAKSIRIERASVSEFESSSEGEMQGHIEGIPVSVLSKALDEYLESEGADPPKPDQQTSIPTVEATDQRPLSSPVTNAELLDQLETRRPIELEGDLKPILAGFASDYWTGQDLLKIEDDVNALASLVSAWSVEPPLAIGLFGDWGSGKSHFMRQMRQQVDKLSLAARNSPKKQNEIGYYKNIVQIEFNAWHYIEGNLWASLIDHIFANLRVSEKEQPTILEARRDALMNQLGVQKEIEAKLKSKIEERQAQLKVKKKEADDLAKNAEEKKDDASTQLAGFRSAAEKQLNELEVPWAVSEKDKDLLKRLGIEAGDWKSVGDFRRHYDELKGFSNRIAAQWKLFTTDRKVQRRVLLAAGLTVIPLIALVLPTLSQTIKLPAFVLTVLGLVGTFITAAVPVWKQFRNALHTLEEHDAAVERERQKRIGDLQAEVTALAKTVHDAQAEAKSIKNEIDRLDAQIKSTSTSQILAEFIEDRAAASDYRRHLGLLALIRRDFEKLRDLFNEQRKEEEKGNETHHQNRINRIILYIDDLDRCGPQRVVEVLQAIHLLLAFPIFVVVVGVDARWITRSLQESYEWLRQEDDDERKKEDRDAHDRRGLKGATPHDYLEKIFQIPFWLRPMEEDQCKSFIQGLTEQVRYRPTADTDPKTNGDTKPGSAVELTEVDLDKVVSPDGPGGNGHPPAGEAVVETAQHLETKGTVEATPDADVKVEHPDSLLLRTSALEQSEEEEKAKTSASQSDEAKDQGDASIDLAPQSLTLGDKEIEYMTSLAKLIGRSPRAVKRFLNCYRLIKVSLPPERLKEFVRDGASYEYRAVMILLGIITGAPTVSLHVIEEIEKWKWEKEEQPTIKDFLDQLERSVGLQRTSDWDRLRAFLATFGASEESAAMFAALRAVTPRVSRFSFRISRAEAAGPKRTNTSTSVKV